MPIVIVASILATVYAYQAVDLRTVQTLTFEKGRWTTYRRTQSFPQLVCSGGDASNHASLVQVVQCQNSGVNDLGDVQWTCKSELPNTITLGTTNVVCEGFSGSNDIYKLAGSCNLEYTLHLTEYGKTLKSVPENKYSSGKSAGESLVELIGFIFVLAAIFGVVIATVICLHWCCSCDYDRPIQHVHPPPFYPRSYYPAPTVYHSSNDGFLTGYTLGSLSQRHNSVNTTHASPVAPPHPQTFSSQTETSTGYGTTKTR